uniref:uncharacterized protein LOC120336470 n=1 Tax=Styela clava TaxID=7725 RepID=UPI0019395F2D|nr:uncharacterized protein LOC120336470 [Styela clava]
MHLISGFPALLLICVFSDAAGQDFMGSLNALVDKEDLTSLSQSMESAMDSVGGLLQNPDMPGFDEGMKDVMSMIDSSAASNMQFDKLQEFAGQIPMDIEQHMQGAVSALGPMSCLVGNFDSDPEIMGLLMGGLTGAMFGEAMGEDASSSSYDMKDPFAEMGALAGVMGAAAGGFMPDGADFDPGKFKEMMPDPGMMEDIWKDAQNQGSQLLNQLPEDFSMDKLENLMQESSGSLNNLVKDFGRIASSMNKEIAKDSSKKGRLAGNGIDHIPGVNNRIQRKATGMITSSAIIAGAIGDSVRRSQGRKVTFLSKKDQKPKIEFVLKKLAPILTKWKKMGQTERGGDGGPSLSLYSRGRLQKLALDLALSVGHFGGHIKSIYDFKVITSTMTRGVFAPNVKGKTFDVSPVTIKKKSSSMTTGRKGRMSYKRMMKSRKVQSQMENCMGGVMPIISEIKRLSKMMMPQMKILDWDPPFHTKVNESWSKIGLPKFVAGNAFNEKWDFEGEGIKFDLPNGLSASDFSTSFVPNLLEDPVMVDFISYASRTGNTKVIDYLKGSANNVDLAVGTLRALPMQVLENLQNKDGFTDDNMLDVLENGRPKSDYTKFAAFIEGLSNQYIQPLITKAKERYSAGTFTMNPWMAEIINKDISRRTYNSDFQSLISNLNTPGALVEWMCPAGIFDYVLDEFKDSILDAAAEISECISSSLGRFSKNSKSLMKLRRILQEKYADGITPSDASRAGYLINFLPHSAFQRFSQSNATNLTSTHADNFLPILPGFKTVADSLAAVATIYYTEVNNTDIIRKLGPVSCALRRYTAQGEVVHISDDSITVIRDTCDPTMKRMRELKSEMAKTCMRNRGCRLFDEGLDRIKGYGGRHKKDKGKLVNLRDEFKNILSKTSNEMIQEFGKFGDVDDLTRHQKKEAVRKILGDGIDSYTSLMSIGGLASELPADFFKDLSWGNLTNFVTERPRAVQKMHSINRVAIADKLSGNFAGFLENTGRLKSLTSTIPSYKLDGINIDANETFRNTITSVNWKRDQAFRLLGSSRSVTLNDVRKMGKLAVSLTCHDVRRMRLGSMILIANALENQIGRSIPSDLAECVALKIFLHLQSKYKKNPERISHIMSTEIPPIFAVFFPSETVRGIRDCKYFYNRVSSQLDKLLPHAAGRILLEDLAIEAFNCMSRQYHGPPPEFDMNFGGNEDFFSGDMQTMSNYNSTSSFELARMIDTSYTGQSEVYDDERMMFMKDMMNQLPGDNFKLMGKLLCMITPIQVRYLDPSEFSELLIQMQSCLNYVKQRTLEEIHTKILNEFGQAENWDTETLQTLGPFVSTFSKSTLNSIPKDTFISAYDYMIPPPERKRNVEDKTSDMIDVASLFKFEGMMGEEKDNGPPVFNTSWTPFKRQDFFETAVQAVWSLDSPTLDDLELLGPGALPYIAFDLVSSDLLMSALGLYGRMNKKLSSSSEDALKEKITSYASTNGISKYSDDLLQQMGRLAPIFTGTEIENKFEITKLETLAVLGRADWKDATQVTAVLEMYLGDRNIGDLSGVELVAIGNMHCLLDIFKVDEFTAESLKFALREIGKLRCFSRTKIDLYKSKFDKIFNGIDGSVLQEMGILAAGFTANEFVKFGKPNSDGVISPYDKDVNLIPHQALEVIPASRIISGFDDEQYARLGTVNAGTLLQRQDIFNTLSNRTKNAIFAASFGLNAGVYAGFIHFSRSFDESAMMDIQQQMEEMMKKLQMSLAMGGGMPSKSPFRKPKPAKTKPSQAFGLKDVSEAKRPEPPPLAGGLTKKDLDTFDKRFLNDRVVVEMINSAAADNSKILEVMKGDSSLNDISDEDIGKVPLKLLQGLKKDAIQQMSSEKLAILLDSDQVSKDPKSLSRTLNKLTMEQFKEALEIMTEKMNSSDGTWRPPISTQEAVSAKFFKFDFNGPEDALKSFLDCMCPFSAGIPPRRIIDIPQDVNYIGPVIDCMDLSYKDLDKAHRKQMINWINTMWKKEDITVDKAITLKNFLLDLPLGRLQSAFTMSDINTFVLSGALLRLDTSHIKFSQVAKFIVKSTTKEDVSKFSDDAFMQKLGRAKCEIRLKRVKKAMDSASLKILFDYTMKHCKNHKEELEDSIKECTGDAALRLKRCALLEDEIKKGKKEKQQRATATTITSTKPKKAEMKRMNIKELEMMKDVVDVYLGDKDLTTLKASDVREVAGAIGALKPRDIDKIPEQAILDNIDVLKNNTKLTKRQKRKIFEKIKSAGFELTDSNSLTNLGELVSSVPPKEFKKLSVEGLKESLGELRKHSDSLSSAQKRAIVDKLNTGGVADIMNADLGDLVTEIPLSDLDSLDSIEIEKIKDKPWRRGQAANLVKKFREKSGLTGALTVEDIRTMGKASLGVTCMDVMKMLDDVVYDGAKALDEETEGTLSLDMEECISTKLHYALQVMNGIDYIANSTDPELSSTLSFIPEDVAMMMPTNELERIPLTACQSIMENIGSAELDTLPGTTGDIKRQELANISLNCVQEKSFDPSALGESEVLTLGKLICDMDIVEWRKFSDDGFNAGLPTLRDCFHRLDDSHLTYIESFIIGRYGGDSSQWGEDVFTTLGPLISTLAKTIIDNFDEELFYEFLDDIMPPEVSEDMSAYGRIKYDDFYNKSVDVVMSQRTESRRRKREVIAPKYDEIVILGPGNVAWSLEQLSAISDEDFANSLETLGSVSKWSYEQMDNLVSRMKELYGKPSEWESKEIADAQYLIKGLSYTEKSELRPSDIETCASLSQVDFTNDERSLLIDSYLRTNGLSLRTISSSELVGFGRLICGLSSERLIEIPSDVLRSSTKDLGAIDCFSQTQFDIIKQMSMLGHGSTVPTAPELDEMGTVAAGLSSGDLSALPVESIAFITPSAFLLMTPSRIKDGLNETQILAAGAGNIAALMTPRIFDQLYAQQRNALRLAVYGEDAELEDIPITEDLEQEEGVQEIEIFGDDSGEADIIQVESTTQSTTTAHASIININESLLLMALFMCLVV